jgi:hypothetical protein
VLTLLAASSSFAGERELEDAPPPSSIEEMKGPLELTYPKLEIRPSLFPWIRGQMQTLPPFLADTKLYLRYRSYYLRQDRTSGQLSEAWAMGGSIYYRSGWLKDLFAVELEGFTSQPIVAPAGRGGALLVSLSYDFSKLGIEGLSAIANFARGWDGVVAEVCGDAREIDLTIDYRIGRGVLESLWLRLRASWIEEEARSQNGTDFRVILRYELPAIWPPQGVHT